MRVLERAPGHFTIQHSGKELVTPRFDTEAEAWGWADENIDDQVFDGPNWLNDPLVFRTLQ